MHNQTFQLSIDARLIYDRLVSVLVGETIHYDDLSKILSRDIQTSGRGILTTARKKAMNDRNIVFGVVYNEGLKRLSDREIVDTAEGDINRVRRISRRAAKRITHVDFAALSKEAKIQHNTYLSIFGALGQVTSRAAIQRIESKVSESQDVLPTSRTLEIFK